MSKSITAKFEILFNNKKPDLAVRDLMLRDKKIESDSRNDWK